MNVDNQLTILLTLKDRVAFTSRWMSYANETRFPFKVLIADGGTDDEARDLLAGSTRFPHVNYEYLRYKPDLEYADYYAKTADALGRVDTPYVALADNDDFFVPDILSEAVDFLSHNFDYVSCGGQGAIFWVLSAHQSLARSGIYGRRIEWKCTRDVRAIESSSAQKRVLEQALGTGDTFFYDVKRTLEARKQYETVRELNLRDLFLVEHLIRFLTAVAGKSKRLDKLHLARQHNSPNTSSGLHTQAFGDWFGRMLVESWSADFARFLDVVSGQLAEKDGIEPVHARQCVLKAYRMLLAPQLMSNLLDEPTVTTAMTSVVPMVRRLVRLSDKNILKRISRALYRRISWVSLDSVYGTEFVAKPVPGATQDFEPIRAFLSRNR